MRFLPKLVLVLFFLFLILFSFLAVSYAAENPVPPPTVSCGNTDSPEFHSLRPYQASPCKADVSEEALFCGNDLVLKDTQSVRKSQAISCEDSGDDKETCLFRIGPVVSRVAVDLSGAELPILGNTELVTNSQSQDEGLDIPDRVNDYVSWYLSGATKTAESSPPDPDTEEGQKLIKDFAGPVEKLTPWTIQNTLRGNTVKAAGDTRHDQVVGCVSPLGRIVPCYAGGGREVRLSEWKNNLPPEESDFDTYQKFWLAYRSWRGDVCISLFGATLCIDDPFTFRYPGNLFSYIPFSSTEDRKGEAEVETVEVQRSGDVLVSDLTFSNQTPADLFFAHLEEANELGEILQSTFVPKGQDRLGGSSANAGAGAPSCDLAQIRTNPGDNLFAGEIAGDLSYVAEFSCEFAIPDSSGNSCGEPALPGCPDGETCNQRGLCVANPNPSCSKDIFVSLGLITKTPLADEVYSRLVDGSASVFKRIFPKIEPGGALSALLDIPGATKVEYKSISGPQLVYAGNPGNERKGEDAELYFPHVGSLSEYFLKGIQTILRPKGYGEQIISGQPGTVPTPPPAGEIDCNKNAPAPNVPRLVTKERFAALADIWISSNNFAGECFNDVVGRAKRKGVNPAYFLLVWLIESGASNKDNPDVQDFGVNLADVVGFSAQADRSLGTLTGPAQQNAAQNGIPPWPSELFGNIAYYVTGEYNQTRPDYVRLKDHVQKYFDIFTSYFTSTIAPGCNLPTGPADNACP